MIISYDNLSEEQNEELKELFDILVGDDTFENMTSDDRILIEMTIESMAQSMASEGK